MKLLETLRKIDGWTSDMEYGIVTRIIRDVLPNDNLLIKLGIVLGEVCIDVCFEYDDYFPSGCGKSLLVLDDSLCPDGCLRIDDEQMIGIGDIL